MPSSWTGPPAGDSRRFLRLSVRQAGGFVPGGAGGFCGAEPERLGGRLAALLAEPLRLGAVRRLFQLPNLPVCGLDAPDLAGGSNRGLGSLLALHPAVWEGASAPLARSVRRVYRPVIALALGLFRHGLCRPAHGGSKQSDQTVMSFYDLPYLDGVVCPAGPPRCFRTLPPAQSPAGRPINFTIPPAGNRRWHLA